MRYHIDVSVSPCGVNVRPSTDVRNFGVLFDATLSLKTHVTQLVGRCYGWLRRIRSKIRDNYRDAKNSDGQEVKLKVRESSDGQF